MNFKISKKTLPLETALYWQAFLTTLEVIIAGFFLLRARSLGDTSLFGGYSLPRLLLIGAWMVILGMCVWVLAAFVKRATFFNKTMVWCSQVINIEQHYAKTFEWIALLAFVCFVSSGLFVFQSKFWLFLWPPSLVLLNQYFPVLIIIGIWACQTLFLMWLVKRFPWQISERAESTFAVTLFVFLFAFFAYGSTFVNLQIASGSKIAFFPELAEAFLNGKLYLVDPISTKDLTLFNGNYYVSFPPLAALLMMPIVAWRGTSAIDVVLWNNIFAALGVTIIYLALEELRNLEWSHLGRKENFLLAIFLGFGTVQYSMATRGLVYYISQILTATFLSLSLWLALKDRNHKVGIFPLLSGAAFGAMLLARPNVAFAAIALVAIRWQKILDWGEFSWGKLFSWVALFSLPVLLSILSLLWYNQIRFGSFFDFGYRYMLVEDKELLFALANYGQFHPHFIWRNFYDNFLRLPYWDQRCQVITPHWRGMSVFIISPVFIYLYRALKKKIWIIGLWISVGLIFASHMLYFNSGALQFGYRFSLDYTPLMVLLLAVAFQKGLSKKSLSLFIISFVVNYIGVLWIARQWCENW